MLHWQVTPHEIVVAIVRLAHLLHVDCRNRWDPNHTAPGLGEVDQGSQPGETGNAFPRKVGVVSGRVTLQKCTVGPRDTDPINSFKIISGPRALGRGLGHTDTDEEDSSKSMAA
jgi:hypothetical protein